MNQLVRLVVESFGLESPRVLKEDEGWEYYEVKLGFTGEIKNVNLSVLEIFQSITNEHKVSIDFYLFEGDEPKSIKLDNKSAEPILLEFNEEYRESKSNDEENSPYLNLSVKKSTFGNNLLVVDVDLFCGFFCQQKLFPTLEKIANTLDKHECLHFYAPWIDCELSTSSISFGKDLVDFPKKRPIDKYNKCKDLCSFLNLNQFKLIPDDFILIQRSRYELLDDVFDKLSIVLLCGYIFNNFQFDSSLISEFNLLGYKNLKGKASPDKVSVKTYSQIYYWIYESSNISDKLGLARNMLSLNIQLEDYPFFIPDTTYYSIISNYDIYLLENVEKYIETKNKLNEYIVNNSAKGSAIIENFSDSFKKSAFSFLTFFLSVIVFKLLKGDDLKSSFRGDIKYVSLIIVGVALFYFFISLWEVWQKKNRFNLSYERFKDSYSELFDPGDLNSIFNHDIQHKEDVKFIKLQIVLYSALWFTSIMSVVGIIFILS